MATPMTEEQFQQVLRQVRFAQFDAKFDGTRTSAAVDEFITRATLYKTLENIADAEALVVLPVLLTGEANQWWKSLPGKVDTWDDAIQLIRDAFAPSQPNHQLFADIFADPQPEGMSTDRYIQIQRERLSRMSRELDDEWQIDIIFGLLRPQIRDKIQRERVNTFWDLATAARAVEEGEEQAPATPANVKRRRVKIKCNFCKSFGHVVEHCRKRMRQQENATVRCYGCQRPGVSSVDCPVCNGSPTRAVSVGFCALDISAVELRREPAVIVGD